MASFHHPGDPYFPNQGNGGWIEEDPKEDPKEIEEEEIDEEIDDEEEEDDDWDAESKVINPPYMARVPTHHLGPNAQHPLGPMTWSNGVGTRDNVHRSGWSEVSTIFATEGLLTDPFLSWSGGFPTSRTRRRREPIESWR